MLQNSASPSLSQPRKNTIGNFHPSPELYRKSPQKKTNVLWHICGSLSTNTIMDNHISKQFENSKIPVHMTFRAYTIIIGNETKNCAEQMYIFR